MKKITEIENIEQFWKIFDNEDKPVLIDFYATWCAPCKAIFPVFEAISEEYNDKIEVIKVNIEDNPELAAKFMVRSVPTVVTSSRAEIVQGIVGTQTPSFYKEMVESAIYHHS